MKKWIMNTLKNWLPLALGIGLMGGLIYLIDQQNLRLGANQPQIQMAEDTAMEISSQQTINTLIPAGKVEISQSLAPYLIVFDGNGKIIGGNATLHGSDPVLPPGTLDSARQTGENRVTWQPEPGVRSAAVIAAVAGGKGGFVLAGRSLREVETLTDGQLLRVTLGVVTTLAATLVLTAIMQLPQVKGWFE